MAGLRCCSRDGSEQRPQPAIKQRKNERPELSGAPIAEPTQDKGELNGHRRQEVFLCQPLPAPRSPDGSRHFLVICRRRNRSGKLDSKHIPDISH